MKIKRAYLLIGSLVFLGVLTAIKTELFPVIYAKIQDAIADTITIQYDTSLRGGEGAAVSPDIKQMAFCKRTQEFFVRDISSGEITTYPTQDKVYQVKYSPDGKYLIAGRNVFNLQTGQITQLATDAMLIHYGNDCMAFSPDGESLAIVNEQPGLNSRPYTIEIWNLQTRELIQTIPIQKYYRSLTGYGSSTNGLAFSKDGRYLAIAGKMITIWDIQEAKCVKTLVTNPNSQYQYNKYNTEYTSLTYSPDGKYIVAGFISVYIRPEFYPSIQENVIEIWDVEQAEVIKTLEWERHIAVRLMYSPDGKYFATARNVGTSDYIRDAVWIWDAETWQVVKKIPQFPDSHIYGMGYSEDGRYLWVSGAWRSKIWRME